MKVKAITGDLTGIKTGAVIVTHFERVKHPEGDAAAVDKATGGAVSKLITQGDIKGKLNEVTLLHNSGKLTANRVAVLGLGKKRELNINRIRNAAAEICRYLRSKGVKSVATGVLGAGINGIKAEDAVQAVTEGALLGLYSFRRHVTKKENHAGEIKELLIAGKPKAALARAITRGQILAEAANWTRDIINEPSNFMTPTHMADAARQLAEKYGMKFEVFGKEKMVELDMGGLLGVSQGSQQPPKFIILSYQGKA